jgi:hypothetical protein
MVDALDVGLDGVTVALARAKITRDTKPKLSKVTIAILMDTERRVRVPVSCQAQ